MEKMKVFFIAWLLTVSGFTFYTYINSKKELKKEETKVVVTTEKEKWTTYKKFGPGSTSHPSTEKELHKIKVAKKSRVKMNSNIRKPASKIPTYEGRKLMGNNISSFNENEVTFVNEVNPDWESILGDDLVRFQRPSTKVLVKKVDSFVQMKNGKGRYVEKVLVTYLLDNGAQNSFNALVDSETGKVLERWNKTIHEHFKRQNRMGLKPTGTL